MFKEQRDGWLWVLREATILDPWFNDYKRLTKSNVVKYNPVRTVFRYEDYYIKLDRPEKLFHKLRGSIYPKAKIEFEIALKLESCSIPVVEHLGWGQCGSASMLVTRAFPNAVTVMDYWLESCVYGKTDPTRFLTHFSTFLKAFFASNCYHPDFHTGNILYNPKTGSLALVDLYGIKLTRKPLLIRQRMKMYGILTGLRAVLSDADVIAFIDTLELKFNHKSSKELWQQLCDYELLRVKREWPKREKQIIAEYDKFMTRCDDASGKYLFRNNQNRQPYINPKLPLNTTKLHLHPINLITAKAEKMWVESFLADFLGKERNMPLVWYQQNNSNKSTLYFRGSP